MLVRYSLERPDVLDKMDFTKALNKSFGLYSEALDAYENKLNADTGPVFIMGKQYKKTGTMLRASDPARFSQLASVAIIVYDADTFWGV